MCDNPTQPVQTWLVQHQSEERGGCDNPTQTLPPRPPPSLPLDFVDPGALGSCVPGLVAVGAGLILVAAAAAFRGCPGEGPVDGGGETVCFAEALALQEGH